jgi:hypothetical protein
MSASAPPTSRLLIISRNSGGLNDEIEAKLREALADRRVVEFGRSPVTITTGASTLRAIVP